jgi:hypothetical protein
MTMAVYLNVGNSCGPPITGATVTIGGYTLTETAPGNGEYEYTISTPSASLFFVPGSDVTMTAVTSIGTITSTTPAPGPVDITQPVTGATLHSALSNTISWTYPYGAPATGVQPLIYNATVTLYQVMFPPAILSTAIPAGIFTLGTCYIKVESHNDTPIAGVNPGSTDFTGGATHFLSVNVIN